MKILFLTSGSARSNFTLRALSLARELRLRGHRVALVCPAADKYNGFHKEELKELDGVSILQPWQLATERLEVNLLPYIFGAAYSVLREKPDLVYIYKPTPISLVGLLAKLLRGTPVVLDMDDLGSEVMRIEGHPAYQRLLVGLCEDLAARYADRLVVASRFLRERYQKRFPDKPLFLMPNGIDATWTSPTEPSERERRIVFMGSINRRTILEPLFAALPEVIEQMPDTELLLMGDGKYLDHFKEESCRLGIEKHVTFTGWLPLDEMRQNLRAGDLGYGFMPDDITTRAASNLKTPQYMVRGVVPLVSKTGDLPLMVNGGRTGYITPSEDPVEIREEILRALTDPERPRKAELAREFALKNLTWTKLAEGFDLWLGGRPARSGANEGKRRIYVATINPPANVGGPEMRNLNLLRQLARDRDNQVELFTIAEKGDEQILEHLTQELGIKVRSVRRQELSLPAKLYALLLGRVQPFMEAERLSGLGEMLREAAEEELPDLLLIEQLEAYYCLRPQLGELKRRGVKIVLDMHNVEIEAFRGALCAMPFPKRLAGRWLSPPLEKMERESAMRADAIFACSEKDAAYFRRFSPQVEVIPNGVDGEEFRPHAKDGEETLIFMGGTQYAPNADALRFYLSEVHPRVRQSCPGVHLLAIGASAKWLKDNHLAHPSVSPLGFVEDVRPYLDRAAVGICPIRQGSGTRLKLLTFLSAALPVVSTRKGAEGIDYRDKRDLLLADSAQEFAQRTVELLRDREGREELGERGRDFVLRHYGWDVIGEKMRESVRQIVDFS